MPNGTLSTKEGHKRWRINNKERLKQLNYNSYHRLIQNPEYRLKINAQATVRRNHSKEGAACELIKQHHEDMKHDPERLTTEFMKKIIKINCKD